MPEQYWMLVNRVLASGRMSNSYKPALLRALADYGASGRNKRTVSWEWLAARFVDYYWPLAVRYRIRQATDPTKEPVVVRHIKALSVEPRMTVKQYRRREKAKFDSLVRKLAKPETTCCLDEVVPRFHNLRSEPPAILYDYDQNEAEIEIRSDALSFLRDHHQILRMLAIGRWVQFTEKFSSAPRLWEKIEGKARRRSLNVHRNTLLELGLAKTCFYCRVPLELAWDVDHFLPWAFVMEDRLWNLVPSCKSCNGQKSDGIPAEFLGALAQRNDSIIHLLSNPGIGRSVRKDFKEWIPSSLTDHISLLCRNALAEGFPTWQARNGAV